MPNATPDAVATFLRKYFLSFGREHAEHTEQAVSLSSRTRFPMASEPADVASWLDNAPRAPAEDGGSSDPAASNGDFLLVSKGAVSESSEPLDEHVGAATYTRVVDHQRQVEGELRSEGRVGRRREQLEMRKRAIEEHLDEVAELAKVRDDLELYPESPEVIFGDAPVVLAPEYDEPEETGSGEGPPELLPPPEYLAPNITASVDAARRGAERVAREGGREERERDMGREGELGGTAGSGRDELYGTAAAGRDELYNSDMAHNSFGKLMGSLKCLDAHVARMEAQVESCSTRATAMEADLKALLFLQRARAVTIRHAVEVLEVGCQNLALEFIRWSRYAAPDVKLSYLHDDLLEYPFFSERCSQLVSSAATAFERMKEIHSSAASFFDRVSWCYLGMMNSAMEEKIHLFSQSVDNAFVEERPLVMRSLVNAHRSKAVIGEHADVLFCAEASAVALCSVRGYKFERTPAKLEGSRAALACAVASAQGLESAVDLANRKDAESEHRKDAVPGHWKGNAPLEAMCRKEEKELSHHLAKWNSERLDAAKSSVGILEKAENMLEGEIGAQVVALDPVMETLAAVIVPCCTDAPKPQEVFIRDKKPWKARAAVSFSTAGQDGDDVPPRVPDFEFASESGERASRLVGLHASHISEVLPSLEAVGDAAIRDVTNAVGMLFNDDSTMSTMAVDQVKAEKERVAQEWLKLGRKEFQCSSIGEASEIEAV